MTEMRDLADRSEGSCRSSRSTSSRERSSSSREIFCQNEAHHLQEAFLSTSRARFGPIARNKLGNQQQNTGRSDGCTSASPERDFIPGRVGTGGFTLKQMNLPKRRSTQSSQLYSTDDFSHSGNFKIKACRTFLLERSPLSPLAPPGSMLGKLEHGILQGQAFFLSVLLHSLAVACSTLNLGVKGG